MTSTSPMVTWDGLNLNPLAEDASGVLAVVEDVTGWYDTPDYNGNDTPLVLADGSVLGPKTAASRVITISGAVTGPPPALATYRDQLVVRAAALAPARLTIPDAAGRSMTARVRCDSDGFKHTFSGPNLFTYQATLTAADPRLYGPATSATLLGAGSSPSGWTYGTPNTRNAWSTVVSVAARPGPYPWLMHVLELLPTGGAVVSGRAGFTIYTTPATPPTGPLTYNIPVSATSAGVLGVTTVILDSPTITVTVADTKGNTWSEVQPSATDGTVTHRVFISENMTALAATDFVSVTVSAAPHTGFWGIAYTVSGAHFKALLASSGNSATATITVPHTDQNVVLFAMPGTSTDQNMGYPAGTGWTQVIRNNALNWSTTGSYQAFTAPVPWKSPGMMRLTVPADVATGTWPKVQSELVTVAAGDVVTMTTSIRNPQAAAQQVMLQLLTPDVAHYVQSPIVTIGPYSTGVVALTFTVPASYTGVYGRILMGGPTGNGAVPAGTVADVQLAQVTRNGLVINATPAFGGGLGGWTAASGAVATWVTGNVRVYKRVYTPALLPNAVILVNTGNVPAPVTAVYSGDLTQSRLVDSLTGNTINFAALAAGAQVAVDTATLEAWADGGASRASYVLPGSVPLLIPPLSSTAWDLYAAGSGTVTLTWSSAWH